MLKKLGLLLGLSMVLGGCYSPYGYGYGPGYAYARPYHHHFRFHSGYRRW